ncbi:MAG: hypothetical protein K8D98_01145 [Rhodanobacter sp.]|nr:hypothetical protein [Rhodanobacter sp.]
MATAKKPAEGKRAAGTRNAKGVGDSAWWRREVEGSVWQQWCARTVICPDTFTGRPILIEPGCRYFVQAINELGGCTRFCCEGHPTGFYIAFDAPFDLAQTIANCGFFTVELMRGGGWRLSCREQVRITPSGKVKPYTMDERDRILTWAADAWECGFVAKARAGCEGKPTEKAKKPPVSDTGGSVA